MIYFLLFGAGFAAATFLLIGLVALTRAVIGSFTRATDLVDEVIQDALASGNANIVQIAEWRHTHERGNPGA